MQRSREDVFVLGNQIVPDGIAYILLTLSCRANSLGPSSRGILPDWSIPLGSQVQVRFAQDITDTRCFLMTLFLSQSYLGKVHATPAMPPSARPL